MHTLELRAGAATLRLLPEAGGRITACTLAGPDGTPQPVLQPYPEGQWDPDQWPKGGVYPLIPYSGRVRDAQLQFNGRAWPLAPHPGSSHTLHGIAQRRYWTLGEHGTDHARMVYRHKPDAHWPWAFEAEQLLRLAPTRLQVELRLRNTGEAAMPAGMGLHPYVLLHGGEDVVYDAGPPWPFDADYLALTPPADAERTLAHRLGPELAEPREVTYFHAGWRGALRVVGVDGRTRLWMHGDGALDQLLLHRPAGAPYLCAEPVSHVADGFNLLAQQVPGTGTRLLEPGAELRGGMLLATEAGAPPA